MEQTQTADTLRAEQYATEGGMIEIGTIVHDGREFSSGGAAISEYAIVGYFGTGGTFTDWAGNVIGHYRVLSKWSTPRSWLSSFQLSAEVTLRDGRKYIVRGAGEGMLGRGRRASAQLRPIRRQSRRFEA